MQNTSDQPVGSLDSIYQSARHGSRRIVGWISKNLRGFVTLECKDRVQRRFTIEREIEANEGREETDVSRGKNAAKEPRGADP
ncbi:hypothetical protein K0M31_007547 [Melipona bicolor]|uniref:Uncharacterized protein n=1 Tax=Melipona bicolor TaxID=60889 RepID=A0AA40KVX2_9HYME|nr:hypothetical protein K0M31_007547 [Melipona bicolor]